MNLPSPSVGRRALRAFTYTEMMISMSIFAIVVGGMIYSHLVGLQLNEWTARKLGADDQARRAFTKLQAEIRGATTILIGSGDSSSFTSVADGSPQQGMALQIYPTVATNNWVRYYFDASVNELRRLDTAQTSPTTVAQSVTNLTIFQAEDYLGNVLNDNDNNRVINITLQFYQLQYPMTKIGPSNAYDFYQLQAKITRRSL